MWTAILTYITAKSKRLNGDFLQIVSITQIMENYDSWSTKEAHSTKKWGLLSKSVTLLKHFSVLVIRDQQTKGNV